MKIPRWLISLGVYILGGLLLLLLQTSWFIQKAGLNVGFIEGFKLLLVTMLILSPIILFVIALARWTRKKYKEIPEDLKYSKKIINNLIIGGVVEQSSLNEYANKKGETVDLNQEKNLLESDDVRFRGLFTAYGKRLILTKTKLIFITDNTTNRQTYSRKSFKSDFDAFILQIEDISKARVGFGFPKGFLIIETKKYGEFQIQTSNPGKWAEEINKLIK